MMLVIGLMPVSAWNIKVRALFSSHPYRIILTGLTTANEVGVLLLNPASSDMPGTIYGAPNNFVPLRRIIIIKKMDTGGNLVAVGVIQRSARALDENLISFI